MIVNLNMFPFQFAVHKIKFCAKESSVDPSVDYFSILYYDFWVSHCGRDEGIGMLNGVICYKELNIDN